MKIGILGLGEGRSTMSAVLKSEKLELKMVCDMNIEICKHRAEEFNFHNYTTNYQDMLNDVEIDVFQSVLGFIAPPLAVVFLLTIYWKRTTRKAVNIILSAGSAFSLGTGVVYLWVLPPDKYSFWPHYLMLSFFIFVFLVVSAVLISLLDKTPAVYVAEQSETENTAKPTRRVKIAWLLLSIVMIALYLIFNGH